MGRSLRGLSALAVVAGLAAPSTASASAPANDAFSASSSGAFAASSAPVTYSGTAVDATSEPGEPDHAGQAGREGCSVARCVHSLWYGFTAPRGGPVTVTTCDAETSGAHQLAVYTGSRVDALREVAATNAATFDTATNASLCESTPRAAVVSFVAVAGTAYRIAVSDTLAAARFVVHISYGPYPEFSARPTGRINPLTSVPIFRFVSPTPGSGFRCRLDGEAFADCGPAAWAGDRSFADGTTHTFEATATAAGETFAFPARATFTIDQSPPDTTITSHTREPSAVHETFFVHSSENHQTQSFVCSIDGAAPLTCGGASFDTGDGDFVVHVPCRREHTIALRALDEAGNLDASPARASWTIGDSSDSQPCQAPSISSASLSAGADITTATVIANIGLGGQGTSFRVDYGTTASYDQRTAELPASSSSSDAFLDFLQPSTTYHYRVLAWNASGSDATTDHTFPTLGVTGSPPAAATDNVAQPTPGTAVLGGTVIAHGRCARARFELVRPDGTAVISSTQMWPAIGCGEDVDRLRLPVSGLEPGRTYRFRVVVTSDGGTVASSWASFTAGEPAVTSTTADRPGQAVVATGGLDAAAAQGPTAQSAATPSRATEMVALRRTVARLKSWLIRTRLRALSRRRAIRFGVEWPSGGMLTITLRTTGIH